MKHSSDNLDQDPRILELMAKLEAAWCPSCPHPCTPDRRVHCMNGFKLIATEVLSES